MFEDIKRRLFFSISQAVRAFAVILPAAKKAGFSFLLVFSAVFVAPHGAQSAAMEEDKATSSLSPSASFVAAKGAVTRTVGQEKQRVQKKAKDLKKPRKKKRRSHSGRRHRRGGASIARKAPLRAASATFDKADGPANRAGKFITVIPDGTFDGVLVKPRPARMSRSETRKFLVEAYRQSAGETLMPRVRVSDDFGIRKIHPVTKELNVMHKGTDLSGTAGTPFRSLLPGVVTFGTMNRAGTVITVTNKQAGLRVRHFHCASVKNPQQEGHGKKWVTIEEFVGKIGPKTDDINGTHAHVQIEKYDPKRKTWEAFDVRTVDWAGLQDILRQSGAGDTSLREKFDSFCSKNGRRFSSNNILQAVFSKPSDTLKAKNSVSKGRQMADVEREVYHQNFSVPAKALGRFVLPPGLFHG